MSTPTTITDSVVVVKETKKPQVTAAYSVFASAVILGSLLIVLRRPFLSLFTAERGVVEAGAQRLVIMCLCYWISALMDGSSAASRGRSCHISSRA